MIVIHLERADQNFGFVFARQFRGVERQREPRLVEISAGIFFELRPSARHHIEGGVELRKFVHHVHHAPVIFQSMQARPREHVAAAVRIAVLRLMHVPQDNQMNRLHSARVSP